MDHCERRACTYEPDAGNKAAESASLIAGVERDAFCFFLWKKVGRDARNKAPESASLSPGAGTI